ncbi:MAG: 4,5-DOPA dioxygenase extradiol [Sulfuricurvum sp.]|uniref:4,5-DOPA-extradiol-dioxygenase n=1 Tax=Sulfuricurvum sp. TaxID=2025608 RepID=UPI00263375FF|nr:4,5-DOPA dioxygenase extradiol [Sulfuricurvum sp.]MDD5159293.1 4,5-DOPA dioxygenase extradiol [Sulfuricurvum sp.]
MNRRYFLALMSALAANASPTRKPFMRQSALFISHGSPMNIIEDNPYTRSLKKLGKTLSKPQSILILSAHWATNGSTVSVVDKPETIHDFYGFPDSLYDVHYDAAGEMSASLLLAHLTHSKIDRRHGLDHGAWSVLVHLFPDHNIPVFQLSIDLSKPAPWHYELGKILSPLRDEGIMIIGSGNVTHNLGDINRDEDAPVAKWAKEFDDAFADALINNHDKIINFDLPYFDHAHPTLEHYLPILPILGSQKEGEEVTTIYEGFQHGTLSMRCFKIG